MLFLMIAVAAALAALTAAALYSPLTVKNYRIESPRLSGQAKLRLALVSDLHDTVYGKNQQKLTEAVLREKPDAVLMAGDIFDDRRDHTGGRLLAESLGKKLPCYYVPGNHEYYTGDPEPLFEILREAGVQVMRNATVQVRLGHANVVLGALDDYYRFEVDPGYSDREAMEHLAGEFNALPGFRILMVHRPERVIGEHPFEADLIVSGHAHGGQWRIPRLMNGFYAPGQGFFPRYAGGCYPMGSHSLVVGRGLSNFAILPRIFNPPELVIIELTGDTEPKEVT